MSTVWIVFLLALLMAAATGLGALPFLLESKPTRRHLGLSNAAAGLMLAASLGLSYEGFGYGLAQVLAGAVIGLIGWLLIRMIGDSERRVSPEPSEETQDPASIAARRLAEGEIEVEEYERIVSTLPAPEYVR